MRWDDFRRSDNIDDDRDSGGGVGGPFGGGGGMPGGGFGIPVGGGGLGIGTIIVLGIIGYALGIDPAVLIGGAEMVTNHNPRYEQPYAERRSTRGTPTDAAGQFVAAVLGNTEDTWGEIFQQSGQTYRAPRLVLFNGYDQGACGMAQSATGPFYCPNDQRIYIDTSFFKEIEQRFHGCSGKACEFSRAYVIAHEVGHHVQNLTGVLPRASQAQRAAGSKAAANRIQVRIELQADCYAGVWANRSNAKWKFIEPGDVEAALQTAAAIGDDRLQKQARGTVVPDSFTHGTSEQRQRWFSAGFKSGKVSDCNTFNAASL
ncbi:MAG: YpfJ protein, zinc metalloprotease superfamily [Pseudolabrys sp.]|jgi:predicted metalloprotease|nr:YpfJ protein, zinc metalloprotease superfamily [Pseudolabrys sp.]